MDEKTIRDIPSIQSLLKQVNALVSIKQLTNQLEPFQDLLNNLGINITQIETSVSRAEELAKKAEELSSLPDRFNELFAPLGWVIFETMKLSVAMEAVQLAEAGEIDEAETTLVNYYAPDTVRFWLNYLRRIKAFQPRMRLAELALKDYRESRYHACIPVILALMDGLVNELNGNRGFFADDIELEAWDSIAAHKTGLIALAGIFRQGRNKTRTEQITIPYRNGILHGNDLGYDNQIVAAKTWAALFAVGTWAIKVEKGERNEPVLAPEPTLSDSINKLKQVNDFKRRIAQWKPRNLVTRKDFPPTGEIENYSLGSPERKLVEFLTFWQKKNYGQMANCVPIERKETFQSMPQRIRETYGEKELLSFEIMEIEDKAAATTNIQTTLKYQATGKTLIKEYKFFLSYLDENGKPEVRGEEGYDWYITNWRYFY
jgi:hypothetical protein